MREGELAIFFKSANPGVKRMDEEKKAPSDKLLMTLDVGRRANARGSAALNSARSENKASFLSVKDASLDEFRASISCHLTGNRTTSNGERDCSNGRHLVDVLTAIVADQSRDRRLYETTRASHVGDPRIYPIKKLPTRALLPTKHDVNESFNARSQLEAATWTSAYGRMPCSLALKHVLLQCITSKRVAGHAAPPHGHNPVRTSGEFGVT